MGKRFKPETVILGLSATLMAGGFLGMLPFATAQAQDPDPASEMPATAAPTVPEATEAAPADETAPAEETTPAEETNAAPLDGFDSYTYEDLFSIAVPTGWQATEQATSPQVILSDGEGSQDPSVRTEITWYNEPPDVVVAQQINTLRENGYQVTRYEPENINGTTALNIWLTELPDGPPNAFMTYIGYAESTAAVVSYYTGPNASLEETLNSIHDSFQRLE